MTGNEQLTMKDSGIPLVGKIPNHWEKMPVKYCTSINRNSLPETTPKNYIFRYIDIGSVDFYQGIIGYQEMSFEEAPSRARRIVQKGDVIVSTVRTYLKAITEITDDIDVIVSTGFTVLTPNTFISPWYLSYYCKSNPFCDEVVRNSFGISYPAINSSDIGRLEVTLPPFPEQTAIADFLENKCEKIDTIIALEETTITELNEYKNQLAIHYTTKGLGKSKKKQSGIDWIGEIPSGYTGPTHS
jgi:type I restriction enzyme S subunit